MRDLFNHELKVVSLHFESALGRYQMTHVVHEIDMTGHGDPVVLHVQGVDTNSPTQL